MLVHVFFMACDFKGKCVAKELLDLCMMKWRDSMEFLLESHSTVEKSYRLVYSARNKRCNLPAAPLAGPFIKMVISNESYIDEMSNFAMGTILGKPFPKFVPMAKLHSLLACAFIISTYNNLSLKPKGGKNSSNCSM